LENLDSVFFFKATSVYKLLKGLKKGTKVKIFKAIDLFPNSKQNFQISATLRYNQKTVPIRFCIS